MVLVLQVAKSPIDSCGAGVTGGQESLRLLWCWCYRWPESDSCGAGVTGGRESLDSCGAGVTGGQSPTLVVLHELGEFTGGREFLDSCFDCFKFFAPAATTILTGWKSSLWPFM